MRFRFAWYWLAALALMLGALPAPVQAAQAGGITLTIDKGAGSIYQVGEPMTVSWFLSAPPPLPATMTLTTITNAGARQVTQFQTADSSGVIRSTVGEPQGRHTLRLELFNRPGNVIASGETHFFVGTTEGDNEGPIACNSSSTGQLRSINSPDRWTFAGQTGLRVSVAVDQIRPMIFPPPPTVNLPVSLLGPKGEELARGTNSFGEVILPVDGRYTIVVGSQGQLGIQVLISYSLRLTCSTGNTPPPPPPGTTVTYTAGWNLVGGPSGTTFPMTLHQYDPGINNYRSIAPNTPIQAGQGYWAFFQNSGQVTLGAGSQPTASIDVRASTWVQVGNPSAFQSATVQGADAVWSWSPEANQYQPGATLRPGYGAWAIRLTPGTITVNAQ